MGNSIKFECVRCGYSWNARPKRWKYKDGPKRCPECWSRGLTEPTLLTIITAKVKDLKNNAKL